MGCEMWLHNNFYFSFDFRLAYAAFLLDFYKHFNQEDNLQKFSVLDALVTSISLK